MKSNREHRVPLCGRAVEILDEARTLVEGTSPYPVSQSGRQAARRRSNCGRMLGKHKDRGRATRFSLELPRLGGRGDGSSRARSSTQPWRTCGPEQGRGSLSAHGLIRPPTSAHGRLGGLPGRRDSRTGGRAAPPMTPPSSSSALESLPVGTEVLARPLQLGMRDLGSRSRFTSATLPQPILATCCAIVEPGPLPPGSPYAPPGTRPLPDRKPSTPSLRPRP